jgi:hypothetical protein
MRSDPFALFVRRVHCPHGTHMAHRHSAGSGRAPQLGDRSGRRGLTSLARELRATLYSGTNASRSVRRGAKCGANGANAGGPGAAERNNRRLRVKYAATCRRTKFTGSGSLARRKGRQSPRVVSGAESVESSNSAFIHHHREPRPIPTNGLDQTHLEQSASSQALSAAQLRILRIPLIVEREWPLRPQITD